MHIEHQQNNEPSLIESELSLHPSLQRRVANDVATRARPGIFVYPVFWLILAIGSNLQSSSPALVWMVAVTFLVISIARLIHMKLLDKWIIQHADRWDMGFYLVVFPHSIGWGIMFAYSMTINNSDFAFLMAFSSAGMIAGGTNSFAPKKIFSFLFVITFIIPPLLVSIVITQQWTVTAMLIAYLMFMLNLARQQNIEYWRSLCNEQTLAKLSRTDALTQLDNRRCFDEKLKEQCQLSSRDKTKVAILLVDCDHFKTVNDTFGHDFGDQCLIHLSNIFKQSLPRTTDSCARYGGEEFSIILPSTTSEGAMLVAERIRLLVQETPIKFNNNQTTMTVSIGIVSQYISEFDAQLPEKLFKLADKALYEAKQQGRNRCISTQDQSVANELN